MFCDISKVSKTSIWYSNIHDSGNVFHHLQVLNAGRDVKTGHIYSMYGAIDLYQQQHSIC